MTKTEAIAKIQDRVDGAEQAANSLRNGELYLKGNRKALYGSYSAEWAALQWALDVLKEIE